MCLCLYFAAVKFINYLLPRQTFVIAKTDLIKYMLTRPFLKGRIGKWILALSELTFTYLPQKSMLGQVLADYLVDNLLEVGDEWLHQDYEQVVLVGTVPWLLFFDGSLVSTGAGAGITLVSPTGPLFFSTEFSLHE